MERKSVFMVWW